MLVTVRARAYTFLPAGLPMPEFPLQQSNGEERVSHAAQHVNDHAEASAVEATPEFFLNAMHRRKKSPVGPFSEVYTCCLLYDHAAASCSTLEALLQLLGLAYMLEQLAGAGGKRVRCRWHAVLNQRSEGSAGKRAGRAGRRVRRKTGAAAGSGADAARVGPNVPKSEVPKRVHLLQRSHLAAKRRQMLASFAQEISCHWGAMQHWRRIGCGREGSEP